MELEPEPEPHPQPTLASASDMAAWTVQEAARWVVTTLELPADGEVAAQLRELFEEEDVDGADFIRIKPKRLQKLLRGVLPTDPAEATQRLLQASEQLREASSAGSPRRAQGVGSPHEALTPLSERWITVLASAGPDRTRRLQRVLDGWHPQRWVIDEQELGHGSSAAVFSSTDNRLGEVAIKFSRSDEPRKLEREAALMQRVAHEHVCRLYEHHVSEDGQLFGMVLELLGKGSLEQRIQEATDGCLREFEVVQMAFDVLSALKYVQVPQRCAHYRKKATRGSHRFPRSFLTVHVVMMTGSCTGRGSFTETSNQRTSCWQRWMGGSSAS
jgi:hypothetical protein